MDKINALDIKLLQYLSKHGRTNPETLEQRFMKRSNGSYKSRLLRLQNISLVVYYKDQWILTDKGLMVAQNFRYNDHRTCINRAIDCGLGFISGALLTLLTWWLSQLPPPAP
jgi:hypothetical protein